MHSKSKYEPVVFFWVITLIFITVTTPTFIKIEGVVAKPLSFFPSLLIVFYTVISKSKRLLFLKFKPLFFLIILILIGIFSGLIQWNLIDDLNSKEGFDNLHRSILTLMIGMVFYLAGNLMIQSMIDLKRSETWILVSLCLSCFVLILQYLADNILFNLSIFVDYINYFFVDVSEKWFGRYHGLAYEPSWFGEQILILGFPLILARVYSSNNVVGPKNHLNIFILIVFLVALVLSGSRTGVVGAIVQIFIGLMLSISNYSRSKKSIMLVILSIALSVFIFILYKNEYIADLFDAVWKANNMVDFALMSHFETRYSLWLSAYEVFKENPVIGVGWGGVEVYYKYNVQDWAVNIVEVQNWLNDFGRPNAKNLILRFASEVGIVGSCIFLYFMYMHFKGGKGLYVYLFKYLTLIALLISAMQGDSFALPNLWIALMLVKASILFSEVGGSNEK